MPASFASQVKSAAMYLRPWELIPLYGTEWLFFLALGLSAVTVTVLFQRIARALSRTGYEDNVARVIFAGIVGYLLAADLRGWLDSLVERPIAVPIPHFALLAALLTASCAFSPKTHAFLLRLASIGRGLALVGGLAAFAALCFLVRPQSSQVPATPAVAVDARRPNIVVLSIDTLGATHLNVYGSARNTSPQLEAFAKTAVTFERFYASSNFTTSAVSSLLTSRRPWDHRALQLLGRPLTPIAAQSLPALLHDAGYVTAYFGSNPYAGATRLGLARYFDTAGPIYNASVAWSCNDLWAVRLPYWCPALGNWIIRKVFSTAHDMQQSVAPATRDPRSNPNIAVIAAERWLAVPQSRPRFLWVHLFGPHDPYAPPPPWIGYFDETLTARTPEDSSPAYGFFAGLESAARTSVLESRYDESVRYVDSAVGKFIQSTRISLGPNTIIVVTADHGESFHHDFGGHGGPELYEDVTRVPLLVSLPYGAEANSRSTVLSEQVDLAPTLARLVGLMPPPTWSGRPLLGDSASLQHSGPVYSMNFEESPAFGRLTTGSMAIYRDQWKFVRFVGALHVLQLPPMDPQLFDLTADPGEQRNLALEQPQVAARLSAELLAEFGRRSQAVLD